MRTRQPTTSQGREVFPESNHDLGYPALQAYEKIPPLFKPSVCAALARMTLGAVRTGTGGSNLDPSVRARCCLGGFSL